MNGYIQTNILGKTRGLKFGLLALENIHLETEELAKITNTESAAIGIIVYWGLVNNCFNKKETMDFTREEVFEWVEDNIDNVELFTSIAETLNSSKLVKKGMEIQEAEKKTPGKVGKKLKSMP